MSSTIITSYKVVDKRFAGSNNLPETLLEHHREIKKHEPEKAFEENEISAYLLKHDHDIPYCIVQTEFQCPAMLLFALLTDELTETITEWNKAVTHARIVEHISMSEKIILVESKVPVLHKREDLFYQCVHSEPGNVFYELSTGVTHNAVPENNNEGVRCSLYFASKEIKQIDEYRSSYTVVWQHHPEGMLRKILSDNMVASILIKNMIHECGLIRKIIA